MPGNFSFDLPGKTATPEPLSLSPEDITRPIGQKGGSSDTGPHSPTPDEIAKKDVQHMASGGGSETSSEAGSGGDDVDITPARKQRKKVPQSGRKASSSSEDVTVLRVPASLAAFAGDSLREYNATRTDAVSAYLYLMFNGQVEAPEDIKKLSEKITMDDNSMAGLHREVRVLREECSGLMKQLKTMHEALLESQSMLVWLLGEKFGSPGASVALGAQKLTIQFSDAELIRHRVAMQTNEREIEVRTKRGREIEDAMFRRSQAGEGF